MWDQLEIRESGMKMKEYEKKHMDFFFNPKGIALVGATANKVKGGYAIFRNLVIGFKGGIYPVNPRYEEIDGVRCYDSVEDVPDPVDLAIVFVPGKNVFKIIEDCAFRGIKGVMIEAGGFAETSDQGKAMQEELRAFAHKVGIRLWGPNCMGVVDAVNRKVFSFVSPVIWDELIPGDVSLIVQSGMLSGAFLIHCMSHGTMGISKVCSIGNKMDVDECEILEYLINDPDTKVVGLYLESIRRGRKFLEICRDSSKPIVLLTGGKSSDGAAAALSHTASMAVDNDILSGAMAQAGVTEATDFNQMMDLCRSLAAYPELHTSGGARIAILTYSGGAGILSSDFIDQTDLEIAKLSVLAKERLKTVFPDWMPVSNPIDLWPAVERHGADMAYGAAIEAVCADPGVDAIFIHAFTGAFSLDFDIEDLADRARLAGKPIFCWVIGTNEGVKKLKMRSLNVGIPIFTELFRAVECMNEVFARKKAEDHSPRITPEAESLPMIQTSRQILESETGILDEYLSKQVLSGCGIRVTDEYLVTSVQEAEKQAGRLGSQVVMKGLVDGNIHKTEAGLVKLGISSEDGIKAAFTDLQIAMDFKGKVLIQQQIQGDLELIAGLMHDPQFGPCVMVGFGGVLAEILDDFVFGVAPLTHAQALELIGRLKTQKLLNGFRGAGVTDRNALAGILVKLGQLGCEFPKIKEMDINPLIVCKGVPVAVDASIILSRQKTEEGLSKINEA